MADPVTASIIIGVIASTAAVTSAASATVQAEGEKEAAEVQDQINQRQQDRESFAKLNQALAREGTTSLFKEQSVDQVLQDEQESKWISKYEKNIAKHKANVAVEEAWIQAAGTIVMSGMGVAEAKADAAKLADTTGTTGATAGATAGGASSNLMMSSGTMSKTATSAGIQNPYAYSAMIF